MNIAIMNTILATSASVVPELSAILFTGAVSGVLSFTLIFILKMLVDGYLKSKDKTTHFWFRNPLFRTLAILVGLGVGMLLMKPLATGALVGACGGCLNTVIVAVVKKQIKKINEKEE